MPLNFDERSRILRNVILGVPPAADEDPEAKAWREQCEQDKAAADKAGIALDHPFDSEEK